MERFFYESRATIGEQARIKEFVYRTYNSAESLFKLPWREGIEIIRYGSEKARKSELWQLYCATYPHMTSENFVGFEEWYNSLITKQNQPKRTADSILSDIQNIISMTTKEG